MLSTRYWRKGKLDRWYWLSCPWYLAGDRCKYNFHNYFIERNHLTVKLLPFLKGSINPEL